MVCKQTCGISKKANGDPFWKKIRMEKMSWKKKRYTFQKKFKTLLKKLNGETSIQTGEISIHFF
jgi:hypothetical protein